MLKRGMPLAVVAGFLAGCASDPVPTVPADAPEPSHSQMTFVDRNGCSWWVIGNATNRSWAPQTDNTGTQVCRDLGVQPAAPRAADPVAAPVAAPTAPAPAPAVVAAPALAPAPTPSPAPQPVATDGFVVQVASFAETANAAAAADNFAALGQPVIDSSRTRGTDGFFRLILGPFASSGDAEAARKVAAREGFGDAFVKRR